MGDLLDSDNTIKKLKKENNKLRWILFVELILIDIVLSLIYFTKLAVPVPRSKITLSV